MNGEETKRYNRLLELAEADAVYQRWARSYEDCREVFAQFTSSQPEDVRNFLFGYAECGRLMQQRLVNLARENMIFPDEK